MQIVPTDSSELANHPYQELEPGMYHCAGRLVIVTGDDAALLIIMEQSAQQ